MIVLQHAQEAMIHYTNWGDIPSRHSLLLQEALDIVHVCKEDQESISINSIYLALQNLPKDLIKHIITV